MKPDISHRQDINNLVVGDSVRELFDGDKAELAVQRAKDIGRLMLYKIEQRR